MAPYANQLILPCLCLSGALSLLPVFDFMIGGGLPQPNRNKSPTCKVFVPIDCFRSIKLLSVEILAFWTQSLLGLVVF